MPTSLGSAPSSSSQSSIDCEARRIAAGPFDAPLPYEVVRSNGTGRMTTGLFFGSESSGGSSPKLVGRLGMESFLTVGSKASQLARGAVAPLNRRERRERDSGSPARFRR